jgi:multidrug efflux pump subunit AcrA (membrane-fusion protein)
VSILDAAAPPLGMSASVSFSAIGTDTLIVPMTSIFQQGAQPAVWVIDKDNKLTLRPVRVASYGDGGARITGGLAPGERIVTAGANRLHAGEVVFIADSTR